MAKIFKNTLLLFTVFCTSLIAGCFNEPTPKEPDVIRIGIIPDKDQKQIGHVYKNLAAYLSSKTDLKFDLVHAKTYEDLKKSFIKGEVDLAYFGGYTFMLAHRAVKAEPLVSPIEHIQFRSAFIVNSSLKSIASLYDLEDRRFLFGPVFSTSGHLIPRYHLMQIDITPETFFDIAANSKNHENTVELVATGVVDAGVVNPQILENMINAGKISADQIRIIDYTPTFPDNLWAVQSTLSNEYKTKLHEAFLEMSHSDENNALLEQLHTEVFIPVSIESYSLIGLVIDKLHDKIVAE